MKKKIYFFRFDTSRSEVYLPLFWFSFNRYYQLHGKHTDKWEWIPPNVDYIGWTVDQIVEELVGYDADVYAFSSYMWSWNVVKKVAQAVKEARPNAVLVLGGPHQGTTWSDPLFWFKKHPYFDATCTATEYGEWFIQDALDQLAEGQVDWSTVRNSYSRKGKGPSPNKKEFKFPTDIILSNLDEALKYSEFAKKHNRSLTMLYETNRGCPYGCTYCEWGGGTNAKVVLNSMENIESDLSLFPLLGVESVFITDANFGILKRDVEIANKFAALKGSLKDVYLSGLAKTDVPRRLAVLEPLLESGLVDGYQMSIQTINQNALKAIDRTDITIEENVEMARYLINKYDTSVRVEIILGLPDSLLSDFYDECDVVYSVFNKYGGITRAPFFVLPDSPAASPEYIKKYNLTLVPLGMEGDGGETDSNWGSEYVAIYDNETITDHVVYIPVASSTYSKQDWKEMMFMTDMDMLFNNQHLLKPLIDFMMYHRNCPPSKLLKIVHDSIVKVNEFYTPINKYLTDIVEGRAGNKDWRSMTVHGKDENIFRALLMLWGENRSALFKAIREGMADLLDEQVLDCINYVENSTYRHNEELVWETKWAWGEWEEIRDKTEEPVLKTEKFKTEYETIDWTIVDAYFIRSCCTIKENGEEIKVRKFGT
jgi:hypothetical protein